MRRAVVFLVALALSLACNDPHPNRAEPDFSREFNTPAVADAATESSFHEGALCAPCHFTPSQRITMSEFYDPIELSRLREKVAQMSRTVGLASDDHYTARDRLFRYLRILSRTCRVKSMRSAYATTDLLAPGNEAELKRYLAAGFNTVIVDDIIQYTPSGTPGVSVPRFWPDEHIRYRILKARRYNLSIALKLHSLATTAPNGDTVAALSTDQIKDRIKAWSTHDEGDILCVYLHGDDAFLEQVPVATQRAWRSAVREINDSIRVVSIIGEHGIAASEGDRAAYFDPEAFDILAVLTYPYNLGHIWGYPIDRDVNNADAQLEDYLESYFMAIEDIFGSQLHKAQVVIPVVQGFNYVGEPENKLVTFRDIEIQMIEAPRKVRSFVSSQSDTYAVSLFYWGALASPYGVSHEDHPKLLEGARRGNYTAQIDAGQVSESVCRMAHDTLATRTWPDLPINPDDDPPPPLIYEVSPNPLVLCRGGAPREMVITGTALKSAPIFTDADITNATPPVVTQTQITLSLQASTGADPASGLRVDGVVFDDVIQTVECAIFGSAEAASAASATLGEAVPINLAGTAESASSSTGDLSTAITLAASEAGEAQASAALGTSQPPLAQSVDAFFMQHTTAPDSIREVRAASGIDLMATGDLLSDAPMMFDNTDYDLVRDPDAPNDAMWHLYLDDAGTYRPVKIRKHDLTQIATGGDSANLGASQEPHSQIVRQGTSVWLMDGGLNELRDDGTATRYEISSGGWAAEELNGLVYADGYLWFLVRQQMDASNWRAELHRVDPTTIEANSTLIETGTPDRRSYLNTYSFVRELGGGNVTTVHDGKFFVSGGFLYAIFRQSTDTVRVAKVDLANTASMTSAQLATSVSFLFRGQQPVEDTNYIYFSYSDNVPDVYVGRITKSDLSFISSAETGLSRGNRGAGLALRAKEGGVMLFENGTFYAFSPALTLDYTVPVPDTGFITLYSEPAPDDPAEIYSLSPNPIVLEAGGAAVPATIAGLGMSEAPFYSNPDVVDDTAPSITPTQIDLSLRANGTQSGAADLYIHGVKFSNAVQINGQANVYISNRNDTKVYILSSADLSSQGDFVTLNGAPEYMTLAGADVFIEDNGDLVKFTPPSTSQTGYTPAGMTAQYDLIFAEGRVWFTAYTGTTYTLGSILPDGTDTQQHSDFDTYWLDSMVYDGSNYWFVGGDTDGLLLKWDGVNPPTTVNNYGATWPIGLHVAHGYAWVPVRNGNNVEVHRYDASTGAYVDMVTINDLNFNDASKTMVSDGTYVYIWGYQMSDQSSVLHRINPTGLAVTSLVSAAGDGGGGITLSADLSTGFAISTGFNDGWAHRINLATMSFTHEVLVSATNQLQGIVVK